MGGTEGTIGGDLDGGLDDKNFHHSKIQRNKEKIQTNVSATSF
jgi:hypothetical protein